MLDLKMIFIINLVIFLFFSLFVNSYYKKNPKNMTLKYLSYFSNFYLGGLILLIFRNNIPDFLSIVIANSLFACGTISLYFSSKTMLNLDSQWYNRYLIPLFALFVGFVVFTYVYNDTKVRIIIFSIFSTLFSGVMACFFWFYSSSRFKLFDRLSSLLFLSNIIILSMTIFHLFSTNIKLYYLGNNDFYLMLPNLFMIILNFWIVILIKYRIVKS